MKRGHVRCFWRWPLGHRWERQIVDRSHAYLRCRECGKTKGSGFRPPSPTHHVGGGE